MLASRNSRNDLGVTMRLRYRALSALALIALSGCATPYVSTQNAAPENLGKTFSLVQLSLKGSGAALLVAVHPSNDNGHLKVCGLYLLAGDEEAKKSVDASLADVNSNISLGATNDSKGVLIHPSFMRSYLIDKDSPIAHLGTLQANPAEFVQSVNSAQIPDRTAGCVTTAEAWQDAFGRGGFKINLVKTTYTTTTTYMPAIRHH